MLRFVNIGVIALATAFYFPGLMCAQDDNSLHLFTSKNGKTLSAVLLKVLPEKNQVIIRRDDGQEFETEIILFSLDDQQYIKNWSKNQMATTTAKSDFRMEVTVTRIPGETFENSNNSWSFEETEAVFRIEMRNLSRETLESARIDYAIVWDDGAVIHQTDRGGWTFRSLERGVPARVQKSGEIEVAPLRFNGESSVETPPVRIDEVFWSDGELFREDKLIGIKVCVRASDGTIIHEADSGAAEIGAMSWAEIKTLPDPTVYE